MTWSLWGFLGGLNYHFQTLSLSVLVGSIWILKNSNLVFHTQQDCICQPDYIYFLPRKYVFQDIRLEATTPPFLVVFPSAAWWWIRLRNALPWFHIFALYWGIQPPSKWVSNLYWSIQPPLCWFSCLSQNMFCNILFSHFFFIFLGEGTL